MKVVLWLYSFILLVIINCTKISSFDENEQDAYYKWFDMTRATFNKEQLASKYRKLARQYHPDKNKDPEAEQIFLKIGKAFAILNDDGKRMRYDVGGAKAVDDATGSGHDAAQFAHDIFKKMFEGVFDMDDFFGDVMGGGRRSGGSGRRGRGPTSKAEMTVTLEDLFTGKTMHLDYNRTKLCSNCRGTGAHDPANVHKCGKCHGRGAYIAVRQLGMGFVQQMQVQCEQCDGRGTVIKEKCKVCDGQRIKRESERIQVNVEPGAKDGQLYQFEGMADEHPDQDTGDLVVILKTREHPLYERDGIHLYATMHLTLREALLEFKRSLLQLDGSSLVISRSEITQPGFVERIKGAGMPKKDSDKRGDLFLKFQVVLPRTITKEQRFMFGKVFPPIGSAASKDEL